MEHDPVDIIKKIKIKALSNLIAKLKTGGSLSPQDLKVLDELQREHGGDEKPEPSFDNRMEAIKELRKRGYKLGKKGQKFYNDCAQGLCKVEPDGSILESSLDKYTRHPRAGLKRLDKIHEDEVGKAKTKADLEKIKAQTAIYQFDLAVKKKEYIRYETHENELASRWIILKNGVEYMVESNKAEWVHTIFGEYNPEYARRLGECVQAAFEEQFDQFARMDTFEVEFGAQTGE